MQLFQQPELNGLVQSFLPVYGPGGRWTMWYLFPREACKYDQQASCKKQCLRVLRRLVQEQMAATLFVPRFHPTIFRCIEADAHQVMTEPNTHLLAASILERFDRCIIRADWCIDNEYLALACMADANPEACRHRGWRDMTSSELLFQLWMDHMYRYSNMYVNWANMRRAEWRFFCATATVG